MTQGVLDPALAPSRAADKNMMAALQAIRHVRAKLPRRELYRRTQPKLDVDQNGFPRWILGRLDQIWQITGESEMLQQAIADWPTEALAHRLARAAEQEGSGSPAEQALVAFSYLMHLGLRPLDFMHSTGREHAFVVIGRVSPVTDGERVHLEDTGRADVGRDDSGRRDSGREEVVLATKRTSFEITPETWGPDAVVCDPWRGVAYRQSELVNTEYYYDYYPSESQLYVPPSADAAYDG
jgi:hypothetical protein